MILKSKNRTSHTHSGVYSNGDNVLRDYSTREFLSRVFIDWPVRPIRFRALNFMSLIRYVQGETSLSALSSASKAATSDVGDKIPESVSRTGSKRPAGWRRRERATRASEGARGAVAWKKEKRGLTDGSLKITSPANETPRPRLGPRLVVGAAGRVPSEKPRGTTLFRAVWAKDRSSFRPGCRCVRLIHSPSSSVRSFRSCRRFFSSVKQRTHLTDDRYRFQFAKLCFNYCFIGKNFCTLLLLRS